MNSPLNLDTLNVRVTLDDIFQTVCDLPPDKRSAYLSEACAGDEALRREVEQLVRLYETNESFLEKPAIQDLAMEIAESGGSPSDPPKPPPELLIGKVIGNYRILSTIFVGGMGEVYLARDQKLEVDVAIKFLRREFNDDPEWQARLGQEARLQAELDHPNIVGIRYKGEFDGRPFLVFEFVPGETLKDRLDKGVLPVKDALPLFSQLAEALAYAHGKGIIHRDLKPSNLMITPTGQVKVLDFGIAKKITADLTTIDLGAGTEELTRDYGKTRKGEVMGTVVYMSPEQTRGDSLDASTDIWSFGCVLYEALTGKRPFGGINAYDTLHTIRNDEPDWGALPSDTPESIRALLRRCLQKQSRHRLSSMSEAGQTIDQLLSPPPLQMSLRRRLLLAVGLLAVIFAAVASGVGLRSWWIRSGIPVEKQVAVLPFKGFGNEQAGVGFADELRRNLLSVSEEWQASPPAALQAGLFTLDAQTATRKLGANLIVGGEAQQSGDQIRIRFWVRNAYLYVLKEDEVSGPSHKLAELQNQIARRVAERLNLKLSSRAEAFSAQLTLVNADATQLYLSAIGELQKELTKESVEKPIEILTGLIQSEGDSARFQSALARAYLNKYVFTNTPEWAGKALQACNQAITLASNQPDLYQVTRGLIYVELGKPDEALSDFMAALAQHPRDWEAWNGLAMAYHISGKSEQAEQAYARMIELWPRYWNGYNELGNFYYEQARYNNAIENWRRVIDLLPDSPVGYNNLANAYLQTDRDAEAIAAYQISISKDRTRDNFAAYIGLGTVRFRQEQYYDALQYFRAGLELAEQAGRQEAVLFGNLGDAYRQLARIETLPNLIEEYDRSATQAYDQAINLSEKDLAAGIEEYSAQANLSEWLAKRGKTAEALTRLKPVVAAQPQNSQIAYSATVVYLLAGNIEQALRWFEKAACGSFSTSQLERDPELQPLRSQPGYQPIITKCQQTNR